MRTTISVDDELLAAAKRRARQQGRPIGRVIEDALRRELAVADGDDARVPVPVFRGGGGPQVGVDVTSNRSLREALDADRELGDLR
ncbi:ribbon-helix-helix protein, CopG family [Patulibacter brassicae]|jgi:hypothetical protein|uniref:Ribbon-helix-helix protein, CopG family n=1 Tax=Patulibacter brassicae TaxID=1705717 RepID=A0ABU4VPP9_9ACTN|nr:ribbon-helix-helix protein, CopG family [Patulibacter brassicae]MDX8153818.1 ribbon-helix-helix protein, CopG family [Patulibacter brassicae]